MSMPLKTVNGYCLNSDQLWLAKAVSEGCMDDGSDTEALPRAFLCSVKIYSIYFLNSMLIKN